MINYTRHILDNGLRVLIHNDDSTPMVAVNVLYNVGSKNENPNKTGFAHLFEHLMFGGTKNAPDFDGPLQLAGGENNAFTNNDYTNFYNTVPADNLEVALWLEADRMKQLHINKRSLTVQRKVVVEEFKETCINEPYGDVWHILLDMAYPNHPYNWPTIGKQITHIEDAAIEDVKIFYHTHYTPNNAILSISGNVQPEEVLQLVEKWFGNIPSGKTKTEDINLALQPFQQEGIYRKVRQSNVPLDALYMAFRMTNRLHKDYYVADMISDVLANGSSSRLFRRLLKDQKIVSQIDAYISGSIGPGLFILEARPSENYTLEQIEKAIWTELQLIIDEGISDNELQKLKNKLESSLIFSEVGYLPKAMNLAYFELLGDVALINNEANIYETLTLGDVKRVAKALFQPDNCCILYYEKKLQEVSI
ncbi:MAG: insulinase family protein [Saprospiraceae bacterium]|nr:insulinase family protein [Saprospiraceae bacterium]MBP7699406.1 insulinase family protein [Saprospiraceae bacterium]